MYGGKSCGKTYTLFGPEPGPLRSETHHGIMSRFVWRIFEKYNEQEMTVKVSSFDVTNNDISDLLAQDQRRNSLLGKNDIKFDPATEVTCASAAEVLQYYERSCNIQRYTEEIGTSHTFFKVILEQRVKVMRDQHVANIGKKSSVTFVDLASRWVGFFKGFVSCLLVYRKHNFNLYCSLSSMKW